MTGSHNNMTNIKNLLVYYFQQQQSVIEQNLEVNGILLDRYHLHFGESQMFPQKGYCILLSYLIMDIIYSNIIVYSSIDLLTPDKMKTYFRKCSALFVFYIK